MVRCPVCTLEYPECAYPSGCPNGERRPSKFRDYKDEPIIIPPAERHARAAETIRNLGSRKPV